MRSDLWWLLAMIVVGLWPAIAALGGDKPPPANAWVPDCQEVELSCPDAGFERELCCVPDGETVETACHGLVNRVESVKPSACPGRVATRCVASKPGAIEPDKFTLFERLRLESCYAPPGGDVADVAQCADPVRRMWEQERACHRRSGPFAELWVGARCASDPSPDTAAGFVTVERGPSFPDGHPCR